MSSITYIPVCSLTKGCPWAEHFTLYDQEWEGALSSALQKEHPCSECLPLPQAFESEVKVLAVF